MSEMEVFWQYYIMVRTQLLIDSKPFLHQNNSRLGKASLGFFNCIGELKYIAPSIGVENAG